MNILIPYDWLKQYLESGATSFDLAKYLSLSGPTVDKIIDTPYGQVLDIEITTNRIDCAGVFGIAREARAILPRYGIECRLKNPQVSQDNRRGEYDFEISDPEGLFKRVVAVKLNNFSLENSPEIIQKRLLAVNQRPLNNLIDITNYVMFELGHPVHIFDLDLISGKKLTVRKAKRHEQIITLDLQKRTLDEEDIIIEDKTGKIIDLPGIMGAYSSVVKKNTKNALVFIESINPEKIRKTMQRLKLYSMAGLINEKGPDHHLARFALERALYLYQKIAGAKQASGIYDSYKNDIKPKTILVSRQKIEEITAIKIKTNEMKEILESLSFKVEDSADNKLLITVPTFRENDIAREEDIAEEVARIYGYDNIPAILPAGKIPAYYRDPIDIISSRIKHALQVWGFNEYYSYSFLSENDIQKSGLETSDHLKIINPITKEHEFMRTTLFTSLLKMMEEGQKYREELNIFELSKVYRKRKNQLPKETPYLIFACQKDFSSLKGYLMAILNLVKTDKFYEIPETVDRNAKYFLDEHQALTILSENGSVIASAGGLKPQILNKFNIKKQIFTAYIDMQNLSALYGERRKYRKPSSIPPVIQDFALFCPPEIHIGSLISEIQKANTLISTVSLLDEHNKIKTLRIIIQPEEKPLGKQNESEIRKNILQTCENLGAKLKT